MQSESQVKSRRDGGTYAHKDIAFKFADFVHDEEILQNSVCTIKIQYQH
jgi:hypothetical protein